MVIFGQKVIPAHSFLHNGYKFMPFVPAFCNDCNAIFRSGFNVGGGTATFIGSSAGPCPVCGGMGSIPDGVYTAAGNVLRLLSGPQITVERLQKLAAVIREVHKKNAEPQQVTDLIKKEAPELRSVVDAIPKTRSELYNFILVILTAISVLIAANALTSKGLDEDEIEKLVEDTVEEAIRESQTQSSKIEVKQKPYHAPKKPGRNDPCICGSGKKFKKCCGSQSSSRIQSGGAKPRR